jgi:hypothetical protein
MLIPAKGAAMKVRRATLVLAVSALAAVAALALPTAARAHQADALHQHGWSSLSLSTFGNVRCVPTFYDPFTGRTERGASTVYFPDVITPPAPAGRLAKVWFTARLEVYTSSGWYTIGDDTPWVYALANGNGLHGWYDSNNLLKQAYPPTFGWTVGKGYYRAHLYFYWEIDGTTFYGDATNWCQVA